MDVRTLLERAETPEEIATVARMLQRAHDAPAVLVTCADGRRYVVAQEDESLFAEIPDGPFESSGMGGFGGFGAQWLRGYGRVDEMYRSLSFWDVRKVARADRARVWGS